MPSYVASAGARERSAVTTASNETWKRCEGQIVQGRYRLGQYLGGSERGGVFRTQLAQLKSQTAVIKLVPAEIIRAEQQLSTWKSASQLSHPNLIRIFDGGRCQLRNLEFLYLVTEYAEEQLAQILPQRPLTAQEIRQVLEGTLNVLQYLHQNRFAHAHVRPSNILAIGDQLKFSVDGLLRMGAAPELRKLSVYDAPEIRNTGVSAAADVWSLGMILVEVATQRAPAWDRNGRQNPVVPKSLPPPFDNIAINCLRIEPALRWGVSEIQSKLAPASERPLDALQRGLGQGGLEERRFGQEQRAGSFRPRLGLRNWRLVVPAAALLALAGWLTLRSHAPRMPEPANRVRTSQDTQPERVATTEGSRGATPNHDQPASSVVQGGVLHQVLPDVSQSARNTVQGRVRVRVRLKVDESGNVSEASFASPGPSKYFARLAMQAARDWKFTPPQINGAPVSSEWALKFGFGRKDTEVIPTQLSPP
jgi:TonB family protein